MYFYFFGKIKSIANLSAVRKYKIKNSEKSIEKKKKKQKSQTNGSLITIRWILSFDKLDRKKKYLRRREREREKHLPQNKRTFSPFFQKIYLSRVKINPFHRYVSIFVYRPASRNVVHRNEARSPIVIALHDCVARVFDSRRSRSKEAHGPRRCDSVHGNRTNFIDGTPIGPRGGRGNEWASERPIRLLLSPPLSSTSR